MHFLASKTPSALSALVGQFSIQKLQFPQLPSAGESGSISSVVINSARKNSEPSFSFISRVFFPM